MQNYGSFSILKHPHDHPHSSCRQPQSNCHPTNSIKKASRPVGNPRLHSRQLTTDQSPTNDCTVGNQRLTSRQLTTAQSPTDN
ncbi:MAG: hypothetical protein LBH04_07580 [Tannerellaceae bacterium]|nr:hypothetical protein [Tannerellaceae bacterium]